MRRFVTAGIAAALMAGVFPIVQGCGGGGGESGGGSPNVPGERAVKTTIQWPARSKVIYAPGPALSAKFILLSAKDSSEVGTVIFNRHADAAEYTETVTSANTIKYTNNAFVANIEFHTDADGGGAIVGTATQNVSIGKDGTLLGSNGQEAGFTVNKKVTFLEIPAGQTVSVGDSQGIQFLARAADFTTIALSDGSAFFTQLSGAASLDVTPNGYATGKAIGTAVLTARVEGITSAAAQVNVNLGVATLEIAPGQTIGVGENKTLTVVAKRANGGIVTLPAGALTLTASDDSNTVFLQANAAATGVTVGKTTVTATAAGISSAPTEVEVTAGPQITTASGLVYQERKLTNGAAAVNGKTATVRYQGALTDGTPFDAGTFDFKLGANQVVKGFDEGVLTMKVGAERLLIIPANLGYGDNPPAGGKIPPGATLVFDVTLEGIK